MSPAKPPNHNNHHNDNTTKTAPESTTATKTPPESTPTETHVYKGCSFNLKAFYGAYKTLGGERQREKQRSCWNVCSPEHCPKERYRPCKWCWCADQLSPETGGSTPWKRAARDTDSAVSVASVLSQANSEDAAEYRLRPVCQKKATQGDTTKKNVQKQRQTDGDKWNDSYQHLPTAPTTCHGDATKKHRSIALGKVQLSPAVSVVASKARK